MRIATLTAACLLLSASAGCAAEPATAASALAEMMKQAQYSDGFEARMNVLITQSNGAHPAPFKLAVIGQFSPGKRRLLLRGLSPDSVRKQVYAAEDSGDGRIRAVELRARTAGDYADFSPYLKMFNSGLLAWDMFSQWWSWSKQTQEGMARLNGRECALIHSWAEDKNSVVQEVESCVDQQAKLALRTRIFGSRHTLQRTTEVTKFSRKDDAGALMAKKLSITDADNTRTEIEVYAGDEEYQISTETFSMLGSQTP